jgi:hypothetical protein
MDGSAAATAAMLQRQLDPELQHNEPGVSDISSVQQHSEQQPGGADAASPAQQVPGYAHVPGPPNADTAAGVDVESQTAWFELAEAG